jgi:hypothetical protein
MSKVYKTLAVLLLALGFFAVSGEPGLRATTKKAARATPKVTSAK